MNSRYDLIYRIIQSGSYDIVDLKEKIDKYLSKGRLTEEEVALLLAMLM